MDTLNQAKEKKVSWLVGVDAFSALNGLSIIGGAEVNRSRYSLSLSHFWNSSRIGVYYDYTIIKKYRIWSGIGLHSSFKFEDFDRSRAEYRDSLISNQIEAKASTISFLPDYGETRLQYFGSISVSKELKIYKGLNFNFKVMLVYGYNPYYRHGSVWPQGGVQLYYKW